MSITKTIDKNLIDSNLGISKRAEELISNLNSHYGKSRELLKELLETLRKEGYPDSEIIKIIRTKVKFISKSTIYTALEGEVEKKKTRPKRKPKGIKLPDMPPKSVMFFGNVEPVIDLPTKLYAPLKTILLTAMRDKLPIKFAFKDGEITEIL
jgi:hypothetical protein